MEKKEVIVPLPKANESVFAIADASRSHLIVSGYLRLRKSKLLWIISGVVVIVLAVVVLFLLFNNNKQAANTTLRVHRVGILVASDNQLETVQGFREKMIVFGYQEGENIEYILENPKGDKELIKSLAKNLIARKLDIYVSFSTTATKALQEAQKGTLAKIVFGDVGDYAELGLKNLRNPGKNITGVTSGKLDMSEKRMEFLKEAIPQAKVFAINLNPASVSYERTRDINNKAAQRLGITLVPIEAKTKEELYTAIKAKVKRGTVDGFVITSDSTFSNQTETIAAYFEQEKIPAIDNDLESGITAGYLMSYASSVRQLGSQTATLVNKVLKGSSTDELSVEFPTQLELHLNVGLARRIGIKFPETLLYQASFIKKD